MKLPKNQQRNHALQVKAQEAGKPLLASFYYNYYLV